MKATVASSSPSRAPVKSARGAGVSRAVRGPGVSNGANGANGATRASSDVVAKRAVAKKAAPGKAAAKKAGPTKTKGAVRAGARGYMFKMADLRKVPAGTGYSTSNGGVLEGERMLVGWIDKPRGTGSRMHSHPNEQFNFVVKGTLKGSVNGKPVLAGPGSMIYIPANAPHTLVSTPEEDVIFIAIKDLSHGIIGKAIDGTMAGPHYEPGFEKKKPVRRAGAR